jgi:RHS repeat-associated protein
LNKGYRYDANGELARRADAWHGELAFQHDPTGRILGARTVRAGKTPALHEEHGYDPASNILDPWVEKRGFVQHNRVLVFEDKRYQYDEHGRLIEKRTGRHTTLRLRWNREHQLVESTVERNGAQQSSRYEYDALGRRTLRRDTFGETRFIWDGMRLLQEKRGEQNTTYAYQPGSHEPVARIDDTEAAYKLPGTLATVYHFHTHINGAPEELTNEAGQTLWRARYRAWGSLALEEAFEPLPAHDRAEHATRQPIRMQGQYADTETGLYYNTFRYYDPDIGRFVSEDPIGLLGGLNLYQYAPNADAWVDPWGWAAGWAIIRQFPSNVEGARAGHFTVEVIDSAGASLQTHQVSSHDFKNTAIEKANINGQPVHQVRVKLADADAAKRYQRQVLQVDDLGPYCKKNNSCVTHVEKTLKAGGVTMDGGQARYLRNQGFRPIKKGCPG